MNASQLSAKSIQYRRDLLTFIVNTGAGHTGGSLSCVDLLNVLYNDVMNISPSNWNDPDRDYYVHSKGHSVEALYVVLADLGFVDRDVLLKGNGFGQPYIGHPTRSVPGVEQNTGALGHGLSFAVGLALAKKLAHRRSKVYCLLGDGELAEGSNWEAAMTAAHYQLDNLVAIVDRNGFQITGRTEDVMGLEPLPDKWRSFGWEVCEDNGHALEALADRLRRTPFSQGSPSLLIAHTEKGKGVSFIEGQPDWHHHLPSNDEYTRALAELDDRAAAVAGVSE